jgi:thioester reductase-like protein
MVRGRNEEEATKRLEQNYLFYFKNLHKEWKNKIIVLPGDLNTEEFGIKGNSNSYDQLCSSIDVVLHNGAHVNSVLPYSMLKNSNLLGTNRVIRFCVEKKLKLFVFVWIFF